MKSATVNIHPNVAFDEQAELVEFYRNRNLILAQELANSKAAIHALTKELEAVKMPPAEQEG